MHVQHNVVLLRVTFFGPKNRLTPFVPSFLFGWNFRFFFRASIPLLVEDPFFSLHFADLHPTSVSATTPLNVGLYKTTALSFILLCFCDVHRFVWPLPSRASEVGSSPFGTWIRWNSSPWQAQSLVLCGLPPRSTGPLGKSFSFFLPVVCRRFRLFFSGSHPAASSLLRLQNHLILSLGSMVFPPPR